MSQLLKIIIFVIVFLLGAWWLHRAGNEDLLLVYLCFAIALPLAYLVIDRFVQKNQLLHMKEEALRAELALLKSQINPHFFFNTLNNLYGLSLEKSDLAPQLILKLSDLMRFTIYQGRKDHVLLRDEVAYLDNYLEIQRVRTQSKMVDLVFDKNIEDDLVEVPPLLLIMLVENAFKHGVATTTEKAFVHMALNADTNQVHFGIENSFETDLNSSGGIGLINMKRRLALLFPDRHSYQTWVNDGVYRAELRLEL